MTISKVLNTSYPTLRDSDLISDATRLLLEHRHSALPVVDDNGRYLGIFSMHRLFSLLLPRAVLIEGGVSDLAFVSGPMKMLAEKMLEHNGRRIDEVLVKDAPTAHSDTPLLEVVLMLYRNESDIPVVDREDGRYLGMVAAAELLAHISAESRMHG
jgi:CBS domain-containing protein